MQNNPPHALLGYQILQRLATSGGVIIVKALTAWTDEYFGLVQGLCIALLTFIIVKQLDKDKSVPPRLLKRVCLLYCNQQIRKLFIVGDNSPASIFTDILLALAMSCIAVVVYDKDFSDPVRTQEVRQLLEGLLYLYGNIMDFAFAYGVLKITVCAFVASILIQTAVKPGNQMAAFVWRLAGIVNANLLYQGLLRMIPSVQNMELLQCLASTCILRLILPDMQGYLTYLAAQQLLNLVPDSACIFFCLTVWLNFMPVYSRQWITDMCFTYVMTSVALFTLQVPFWGMLFILVMAHYLDYIVHAVSQG